MSDIHFGDNVTQHGNYNVGIVKNQDSQLALRELTSRVAVLREHVSEQDRGIIDQSAEIIQTAGKGDKGALRRALGNIAGIAIAVGEVGVPVIEAVRKVMAALGM